MAFKHARGPHAGKWEETGRIVKASPSGKAVQFDNGRSVQWLPKRFIRIGFEERGVVPVFMPEWLAKEKKYI